MKWRSVGFVVAVVVFALGFAYVSWAYYALNHPPVHSPLAPEHVPTPALVAKQRIPKGTPGTVIATGPMYAPTTLPKKEVEDGAISDPQWLSGREAAVDIFPGQQLTESDFAPRQLHDAGHGG